MIIDEFCLMAKFTEYNNLYFGGVLPYPFQLALLHGCQTVGYFSYQGCASSVLQRRSR